MSIVKRLILPSLNPFGFWRQFGRRQSTGLLLIVAMSVLMLTGCQLSFLDDSPKPTEPFQVTGAGQNCIENALPVIQNYFTGAAQTEQVDQAWDCASNAVDMFMSYTRGRESTSYTSVELRSFLETYFLGSVRISDPLLIEAMRIKQLVLGGELGKVSRDELVQTRAVLMTLKQESLRLLPYIRLISTEAPIDEVMREPARVAAAIQNLQISMRVLGGLFGRTPEPYELKSLEVLLREIQGLYADRSDWTGPQWLADHISTLSIGKALISGPDGSVIAPNEWQDLISRGGEFFGLHLRMHYLLGERDLLSGDGLDQLHATLIPFIDVMDRITKSKQDQLVPYELIDPVVDEMLRLGLIDWKVQGSTLKSAVRSVLERVTNPPVSKQSVERGLTDALDNATPGLRRKLNGLRPENLARFREGILGWLEMQFLWRELVRQAVVENPDLAGKPMPMKIVRRIWPTLATKYKDQAEDLNKLFNRPQPITISKDGTVIFERDVNLLALDQDGFNSLNWKQSFIRAVVMGYAADPQKSRYTGLSKEEFKEFFDDVRALGVDLKFLDPGDKGIWSSTFAETNMFLFSGDSNDAVGAQQLSFFEGVELISFALSGSQMSRKTYADLRTSCRNHEPDVFGIPKVDVDCYRKRFQESFSANYQLLPSWVQVTKRLKRSDWEEFQVEVENAARRKGYSDVMIESTDVDRGTMVFQYIESLFVRFDANKSGKFELKEAEQAFPLLKSVLAEASGINDDDTLLALFTYLLKYGSPPSGLKDKLWFQFIWKGDRSRWTLEADRRQLLRIIGNLNSAQAK